MEYHLRISVTKENSKGIIQDFITAFKPIKYVSCFEFSHLDKNPHCHIYLKYDKLPDRRRISEFFKKQPIEKGDTKYKAGYYHKPQNKTTDEHICYVIKGGDYILNNMTEDELQVAKTNTHKINENKKLSSKEKLYNLYIEKYGFNFPSSKFNIFKFIDEIYVLNFKKSPLAIGHKICYSIHIIINIYNNINNKTDFEELEYNKLLADLYNIKYQPDKMFEVINDQDKLEYLKNKMNKHEINTFLENKYYDMLKIQTQINNSHFVDEYDNEED